MAEALAQLLDKLLAHVVLLVVLLVVVALLDGGVAADGADVDHAVAELDKGAALDGDVEVGDVVQAEADELLVLGLAEPADEAVGGQLLAVLVGGQAVLGEAEVEEGRHGHVRGAQLLLLLGQVAAAHEADGALLPQPREQVQHLGRHAAPRRRERAIDVEEADGVLEGSVLEWGVADDHGGVCGWLGGYGRSAGREEGPRQCSDARIGDVKKREGVACYVYVCASRGEIMPWVSTSG